MWERAIFFFAIHIFTTRCCQIWHTGRKTTDSLNLLQSVDGTWKEKRVTTSPLRLKEASRSQCHLLAVVRTLRTRNTAKNFRFTRFQFLSKVFLHVFLSSVHLRDTRLTLNITARVWLYFCNSNQTKSFAISWTSDALLYFLSFVCISCMDWNIYYLCLFVALHAFNSSFLWSVLFFFHVFLPKPQKHKVGEDSNIDVWHLWQVITFFVIICVASYSRHAKIRIKKYLMWLHLRLSSFAM